jgi:hypothetical protein
MCGDCRVSDRFSPVIRLISGSLAMVAIVWCWTQFDAVAAFSAQDQAEKAATPTLQEITEVMRARWQRVQSLAVDYSVKSELFVDAKALKKHTGALYVRPPEQYSFAFKGKKRYLYVKWPQIVQLIEPESPEKATLRFGGRTEVAYDGEVIRQKQADMTVGGILKLTTEDREEGMFTDPYMGWIGMSMIGVDEKDSKHQRERLPDAFTTGPYRVLPAREAVDGCDCVVVFCPSREKIWLDPKIGYAPRKWEVIDAQSNLLKERRQYASYEEVVTGVWLPKECWCDWCGPASAPDPYRGQPMYRSVVTVTNLSVNRVPDERFTLQFEPGTFVGDETLVPPKDGKQRIIAYTMPANPGDLDAVVHKAMGGKNDTSSHESKWRGSKFGLIGLVGMTFVLLLLIAARWYRRRRQPS